MKKIEISFKDALQKLEEITAKLQDEDIELEESINLFEEATFLSKLCNEKLNKAEEKLLILTKNNDTLKVIVEDN